MIEKMITNHITHQWTCRLTVTHSRTHTARRQLGPFAATLLLTTSMMSSTHLVKEFNLGIIHRQARVMIVMIFSIKDGIPARHTCKARVSSSTIVTMKDEVNQMDVHMRGKEKNAKSKRW